MDGFRAGFGPEGAQTLLVPMRREQRLELYRRELECFRRASAVFAVSDVYAIELMRLLAESGLSVPGDVSVAGFDDIPLCEMVSPALTTVRQDGALRAKIPGPFSTYSRLAQFSAQNFILGYAFNLCNSAPRKLQ